MGKVEPEPEVPTAEAMEKGSFKEEPLSIVAGSKKRMRRLDGCEIDRLFSAGKLSQDQHHTLELFQADLYRAGLVFCPRAGMIAGSTTGHAQFISDAAFGRVARVKGQMTTLSNSFSLEERGTILSALTMDARVPAKMEDLMRRAANVMSKFYERR